MEMRGGVHKGGSVRSGVSVIADEICRKIHFKAEDIFLGNEYGEHRPRRMCIRLNAPLQDEECRRYLTWNLRKRRPLSPSNANDVASSRPLFVIFLFSP